MNRISDRAAQLAESITLKVTARAAALKKAGVDVVGFGAGEPDFDTPTFIKDAAKAALDRGQTKYTASPALPELRQAIADRDPIAIAHEAHYIKGASANVGIVSITTSANQIERLATEKLMPNAALLVEQMAIDLGHLEAYLATRN